MTDVAQPGENEWSGIFLAYSFKFSSSKLGKLASQVIAIC